MAGAAFKYVPQTAVTIRPLPSILYKSFLNGMEISMLLTAGDNHRERERERERCHGGYKTDAEITKHGGARCVQYKQKISFKNAV